jgi:hypothetical protein
MQPLPSPAPAADPELAWRRQTAPGLLAGVLALATAWFGLAYLQEVPFGGLALNLALAWGAYTVIGIGVRVRPASHAWWVPALAPWLAVAMLLRMHLAATGESLPIWMATTWTLEALAIAAAVGVTLAYGHLLDEYATTRAALLTTGILGICLAAVLVLLHVTMPEPVKSGALTLFAIAVSAVGIGVAAQHLVLRKAKRVNLRVLAGGAALAATASQLLDGFVTYFAVIDPFNLLVEDMHEQVALSAWLLEHTGIGYPVAKWLLALGAGFLLERGWSKSAEPVRQRTGTYLAMIFIGLGPALYSTASLLS